MMPASAKRNKCRIAKGKYGFTLIEVSITITIIGLIIGAIFMGSSLIESSKIRSQISQKEKLITAANTFKVKFNAYPGDITPRETSALGFFTFSGLYAGGEKPDTTLQRFCGYGNNDGRISASERFAFWKHLSEAKMIEGQYGEDLKIGGVAIAGLRGNAGSSNNICRQGNVIYLSNGLAYTLFYAANKGFAPETKIKDNIFIDVQPVITHWDTSNIAQAAISNTSLTNFFVFFATYANAVNGGSGEPTISAYQAYSIDSKIDDGLPNTGTIRSWAPIISGGTGCRTGTAPDSTYDLSPATSYQVSCTIVFLW